jgi:ankyrin repeat protein
MEAASTGDSVLLDHMLEMGVDVNVQAEDGYTALHCAAKTGQVAIIDFLLGKGATVDSLNTHTQRRRPIHEAVSARHVGAIAMLLHAGADLLLPDAKGQTVIDHIGQVGDLQTTQILFSEERKQKTPSELASLLSTACVKSGSHLTLSWLLSQFPDALSQSVNLAKSPIYLATRHKNDEVVAVLLSLSDTSSQSTPEFIKSISHSLISAASGGSDVLVQRLLMCDTIEPNQKYAESHNTALHNATRKENSRVVEMILSHPKINPNCKNHRLDTPLHLAASSGNIDVIKLLLLHKDIDVQSKNYQQQTPLDQAFLSYKWNALRLIADHQNLTVNPGPNITLEDTPTAPLDQHWPLIRLLLDRGLLSKRIASWNNLLENVIVTGEIEVVKFLVDYMSLNDNGFDDTFGGTAILYIAAQHHRHEIFRLYFEDPRIDVNNQGHWRGYTVLQYAIKNNCMTAVKLLLARPETDLELGDGWRRTALDLARRFGKREMFELLLSHGAVGKSLEMDPTIPDIHAREQSCWTMQDEEELQVLNAQSKVAEVEDSDIDFNSGEYEDGDMSI